MRIVNKMQDVMDMQARKKRTNGRVYGSSSTQKEQHRHAANLSLGLLGLVLGELLQDDQRLADLGVQRVGVVHQVKELAVVHLQEHASNLASELGLGATRKEIRV